MRLCPIQYSEGENSVHESVIRCTNLAAGSNFVHESAILCTNLAAGSNSVHESAILCTNMRPGENSEHESDILCTNMAAGSNFVHETTILLTKNGLPEGEATEDVSVGKKLVLLCYELIFDCCKCCKVLKFERSNV